MNRICLYSMVGLSLLVGSVTIRPTFAQERTGRSVRTWVPASRARVVIDREKTTAATFIAVKIILPDKVQVTALEIPEPNRLVFDFTNTTVRKSEPFTLLPNDVVSGIRFGSHSDKMRVVVDLKTSQFPFYEWKVGPKQLLVKILESGKRPEAVKQPTGTPTTPFTLSKSPTVVTSAAPSTAVITQAPKATEPPSPRLPESVERIEEHQDVTRIDGSENLLRPVEPDLRPTISIRPLETPNDIREAIDSPLPSIPAQPRTHAAATVSPVVQEARETPTTTQTPIPSKTPTATKTPTPTKTPVPTKSPFPTQTPAPTHTPTATATSVPTSAPSPTVAPTPPPSTPPAPTNAAPAQLSTVSPAASPLQAANTAVPTQQPITDFHLLNYRFDYLEPGRIPVLKLVLDKSRPQAQISKIDSKTYSIDILNCSLSRPGLALAQYPPAEFRGFLLVSSATTDTRLTVTINVDAGTTLGTFVRNNEIWVKRL